MVTKVASPLEGKEIDHEHKGKSDERGSNVEDERSEGAVSFTDSRLESSGASLPAELYALISADAPQFVTLLKDFIGKVGEMKGRLAPLLERVQKGKLRTSNGVSLLEVKVHSLLSYITNIGFYLMLKLHGRSVGGHPVIDRLVELRIILEKIKPLEQKLKYQIDKLVKAASTMQDGKDDEDAATSLAAHDPLKFKPNPMAMQTKPEEDGASATALAQSGIYRPPKLAPKHYDASSTREKTGRLSERTLEKASRSRMLNDLRAQYDDRPEEMTAEGTGYGAAEIGASKEDEKWAEREKYEEDNYTRLNMTRLDKKLYKTLEKRGGSLRFQNEFDSLDADFQDLRGVNRAVEDEDEMQFGRGVMGKRAKAQQMFGEAANGLKRKYADAGEMLTSLSRSEKSRKGRDEFGVDARRVRVREKDRQVKKARKG